MAALDIVMLSHLSWERKLFQRPQQLALRLAAAGDTVNYFSVERLLDYTAKDFAERFQNPAPRLWARVLPQWPGSWRIDAMRRLTDGYVTVRAREAWGAGGAKVLWCQHPRFAPVAEALEADVVVYDCMDPHGAFARQDPKVADLERRMLARAGVRFAGGRTLARLLRERGGDAECLPSGIDFDHFASAAADGPIPKDLAALSKPVLGYFGAVDERIDWELLGWLSRERPSWNIVLLGPLVGLTSIPVREPNLMHLGPRDYATLPACLRAFDVCLIPWVLNDLTRAMSPTKTPEYLASGRPVVSVAIPDVLEDYGDEVHVAASREEFLSLCSKGLALGKGPPRKPAVSRTWDELAATMRERILARLAGG